MDPYISDLSVNPNNSDRSVDPSILAGPRIPLFLVVHRSKYISDRSVNPYIRAGPWIPLFWSVHRSCFPEKCLVQTKSRFESGFSLDKIRFYFSKLSRLNPDFFLNQIQIWIQSGHFLKIKIEFVHFQIWILSGPDSFQKKIWTRKPDYLDQI